MPPKKKTTKKPKKKGSRKALIIIKEDNQLPPLHDAKNTTIMFTVANSDIQSLNRLITHYDYGKYLSSTDINGSTVIHNAVKKRDMKMLTTLLSYNQVDLDALEGRIVGGHAAIHHACLDGLSEILAELLKHGASVNIKSNSSVGETPLQICCKYGYINCAKQLLDAGASLETRDNFGNNASFWAYSNHQDVLIKELSLPPVKTATAEEFLALAKKRNPKFVLPSIKTKKKKSKAGKSDKKKK
jgi:ankyrin repeat protein